MKRDFPELVDARPPNFDAIAAVLPHAADPGVMFAYDGKVYAPGIRKISRELYAHEAVHLDRQAGTEGGAAMWWEKYLADAEFRYIEELLAHRAEYALYCKRHIDPVKRAQALRAIARRLASPLYAADLTVEQAVERIAA